MSASDRRRAGRAEGEGPSDFAHSGLARGSVPGFTLIEVLIAVTVLAVMIAGASSALSTSWRQNQLMREEAAALHAAEAKIAEIRAMSFDAVVGAYGTNYVFEAELLPGQAGKKGLVADANGIKHEGEVVLILDETPDETAYGRDLDDTVGPDGVDLDGNGFIASTPGPCLLMHDIDDDGTEDGIDLNGDGDVADSLAGGGLDTSGSTSDPDDDICLIPAVVIVRWKSQALGLEGRVQLMTIVGKP